MMMGLNYERRKGHRPEAMAKDNGDISTRAAHTDLRPERRAYRPIWIRLNLSRPCHHLLSRPFSIYRRRYSGWHLRQTALALALHRAI